MCLKLISFLFAITFNEIVGVTRERRLFRNVHTINDFFRQLLDEGIFKERNVVIIQYLMRAINRPDLEQMCIEYARKDHRALCYFEDSTDQGIYSFDLITSKTEPK